MEKNSRSYPSLNQIKISKRQNLTARPSCLKFRLVISPKPNETHNQSRPPTWLSTMHLTQYSYFFISVDFRQRLPTRTVLAILDISKAFDMVSHQTLLHLLPGSLPRLNNYMSGHQAKTLFKDALSTSRIVRTILPPSL